MPTDSGTALLERGASPSPRRDRSSGDRRISRRRRAALRTSIGRGAKVIATAAAMAFGVRVSPADEHPPQPWNAADQTQQPNRAVEPVLPDGVAGIGKVPVLRQQAARRFPVRGGAIERQPDGWLRRLAVVKLLLPARSAVADDLNVSVAGAPDDAGLAGIPDAPGDDEKAGDPAD